MQFNDTTNNTGLCQEIDALCDTDTTSYPLVDKARRVNAGLEFLIGKIINADGTWQYDDTNHTDLPVGTGDLVASQEAYTFASEYLTVESIDILDTDGYYRRIKPIDRVDFGDMSVEEYYGTTTTTTKTGFPKYYDLQGDTIRLYPAPVATEVTLTDGIRVHFQRTADLFTSSDTTQEPGLPAPYHVLLAYMAAVPYCMTYHKDRVGMYEKKVQEMSDDLIKFYSRREKDRRKKITTKNILFR